MAAHKFSVPYLKQMMGCETVKFQQMVLFKNN